MKDLQFSISIKAPKEIVWQTLWQDETFRQWASIIDPQTYMVGELKEGNEVQFISAQGGYGVTSLVEKVIPNEFLILKNQAGTQNQGQDQRPNQWTGGQETYALSEHDGLTTLSITFSIPPELEEDFQHSYPKAVGLIKDLSEAIH